MFKRKSKEKPKRGNKVQQIMLLIIMLLLIASGAVGYWFFQTQSASDIIIAAEPPMVSISGGISMNGSVACSYSQGFSSRENLEIASEINSALGAADIGIRAVTVEENLSEYRSCNGEVTPIYQMCSLLTIHLPISQRDPSEGDLGRHIASILDVLTTENTCTPVEIRIVFENAVGDITWQMTYALAMEAYLDGARGVELYDPRARR